MVPVLEVGLLPLPRSGYLYFLYSPRLQPAVMTANTATLKADMETSRIWLEESPGTW